jgi:hypothetical protein
MYNAGMSKPSPKPQTSSQTPASGRKYKPFAGLNRAEIKVLKPGAFDLEEALRQMHGK